MTQKDLIRPILKKANNNLKIRFGTKHKPIRFADLEKVFSRMLLSVEADAKTKKGSKDGYMTGILYLAPSKISGINTCPAASAGCAAACLFTAGRGVMYPVFRARVIKTLAYYYDTDRFLKQLQKSIDKVRVKANNKNMVPVIRLNGTSDLLWEKRTTLIQDNPDLQFYDYTAISARFQKNWIIPDNYDLTFSLKEDNTHRALDVLANGGRVAAVFRDVLPDKYWNVSVRDGDANDLRFLDDQGVIIGLKAKGPAKKDSSGFVQDVKQAEKSAA